MSKTNQVTCRYCKNKIDKEKAYSQQKGMYYCDKNCFDKANEDKHMCISCKKILVESQMLKVANKWVCRDCYNEYIKIPCVQKDIFLDYIWNLYDSNYRNKQLYFMLKSQIEYYHNNEKYQFKYKGMLKSVKEFLKFENYKWKNEYGLGQVFPKAYYDSEARYYKTKKITELSQEFKPFNNTKIKMKFQSKKKNLPME